MSFADLVSFFLCFQSAPPTPQSVDASGDSAQDTGKLTSLFTEHQIEILNCMTKTDHLPRLFFAGKHHNNNSTSANNNGGAVNPLPMIKPKTERRRTVSMRKMHDAREELLRRSTTPDVKEVTTTTMTLSDSSPNCQLTKFFDFFPCADNTTVWAIEFPVARRYIGSNDPKHANELQRHYKQLHRSSDWW